ncbi:MAG: hypothetical protein K2X69_16420 [Silvanigrellaceae bacterium]|nr:hypothetical protein [Silvanigrellaceae bacterium]
MPKVPYLFSLNKQIFFFFLFSSFVLGCQSTNKDKIKKSSQIDKALVFYASDDPIWLPYFSNSFTRRISEDGLYNAIQNRELNKEWMINSLGNQEDVLLEDKFLFYSNKLRGFILAGNFSKAQKLSVIYMRDAALLLSNNPSSVSFSYATLAFWSAVSNLKTSNSLARDYGIIYEKYSSFSVKDNLESQVDSKLIDKLKSITTPFIAKQKSIKILNSKNCTTFIDGQELKSSAIMLPPKMQSVISASCANGSFSQIFIAEKYSSIKISPYMPSSFYSMPSLASLPKEQILSMRPSAIILIYWSHSGKYMESQLIDPKSFSVVKKTRILLSSKKDLDEAGDNLIAFLRSKNPQSPKTSSQGLTSSSN